MMSIITKNDIFTKYFDNNYPIQHTFYLKINIKYDLPSNNNPVVVVEGELFRC